MLCVFVCFRLSQLQRLLCSWRTWALGIRASVVVACRLRGSVLGSRRGSIVVVHTNSCSRHVGSWTEYEPMFPELAGSCLYYYTTRETPFYEILIGTENQFYCQSKVAKK